MNILFVGGDFSETPKASGYVKKLVEEMNIPMTVYNGGLFSGIEEIMNTVHEYDVVYWFANIPNTFVKGVGEIKERNPHCILITSKNNYDKTYTINGLTSKMLSVKANLQLVFTKDNGKFQATIIDPLRNAFCQNEEDIKVVAKILKDRVAKLKAYTREGTIRLGDKREVPDDQEFFDIVQGYANTFHELIHAENTDRFLGNLSFRCEKGFPSFKKGKQIFVSRRNVDKRDISVSGMVEVEFNQNQIGYYGDTKPSVDTPVQACLYNFYKNMRYMIHSHTYILGAPFTKDVIPCGALEEVGAILLMFRSRNYSMIKVNLTGHGSIVMSNNLDDLKNIKYIGRPIPEFVTTMKFIGAPMKRMRLSK